MTFENPGHILKLMKTDKKLLELHFLGEMLSREQVQEYLKISRGTLLRLMNATENPIPYFKLKRHVLFKKADVEAWLESKRVK